MNNQESEMEKAGLLILENMRDDIKEMRADAKEDREKYLKRISDIHDLFARVQLEMQTLNTRFEDHQQKCKDTHDDGCKEKHSIIEHKVRNWVLVGISVVLLSAVGFFIKDYFVNASPKISHAEKVNGS